MTTRPNLIGVLFIALVMVCASLEAQVKPAPTMPAPVKKAALKPLDINTATEEEIAAIGIDKTAAKKIIEGRPYRNKTELVSRMLLSRDQYDKVKSAIVAKQPPKTSSK